MPINTVEDLKKQLARLRLAQIGPQSIALRFKRMQNEIDELKKRVRRLEGGPDSPPNSPPENP